MSRWFEKYVTGGGCSKRVASNTARKRFSSVIAVMMAIAITCSVAFSGSSVAFAAVGDSDHLVSGVSPNGTTINLFDYWLNSRESSDINNPGNYQNIGINSNNVALKFGTGMGNGSADDALGPNTVNDWTQSAEPRQGIVKNTLGSDGYPTLADALDGGSLSYLFSLNGGTGKAAYADVDGLLRVDGEGYYYYNSQENFAQFNEDGSGSGDFTLYDHWGVVAGGDSPDGQFFPFNTGQEVLEERGNSLESNGTKSTDSKIHHYFGMTMSTRFVQQYGGHTDDTLQKAVTYEFSGDDDVWIYIDGVLVGDLGGIHNAASISINFATGDVIINEGETKRVVLDRWESGAQIENGQLVKYESIEEVTTLKALFRAADKNTDNFDGNTLPDNTYHTLDFFYLERGGTDSNMSLKYNLVTIPETDIQKVDQNGDFVEGAVFQVTDAESKEVICTAETVDDGGIVLVDDEGYPITIDDLYTNNHRKLTFTETTVPEGYRSTSPINMYIEHYRANETANGEETNLLLSEDPWTSGAYAQARVTVTAPTDVTIQNDSDEQVLTDDQLQSGRMFVIVEKKGDGDKWYPVYGDALDGWTVSSTDESDISAVVTAGRETNASFVIASNGAYQAEVSDLPGRIQDYVFFDDQGGTYRGKYYYTTESQWDRVNADNTYEIANSDQFDRQFSAHLYISNIENRMLVRKVDENGNPVNGAEFALYKANDVTVTDGVAVPRENAVAVKSGTTDTIDLENGQGGISSQDGMLAWTGIPEDEDTYYLIETSAPEGYATNATTPKVVVDSTGVYVDAGNEDDGVLVARGVGRVVGSMQQFAVDDDIDSTLHDIKAALVTAEEYKGADTAWSEATDKVWNKLADDDEGRATATHLQYVDNASDEETATFDYAAATVNGEKCLAALVTETGWSKLIIQQCTEHNDELKDNKQDLSEYNDLSNIFSGSVTVQVTDHAVTGSLDGETVLDVQKTFTGREDNAWTDNDVFTFKLTGSDGAPMPMDEQGEVVDTITLDKDDARDGVALGSFGDIAYGNADRGKTYTYTINEVAGDVYGVDYSEAEYKVTVTVGEDITPDGKLNITSTVEKTKDDEGTAVNPATEADVAAFANTYKVSEDTKTVDRVDGEDAKTDVEGKLVGVGDTLEYTIHWVNDAVNDKGEAQDATVTVVDTLPAGVTLDQDSIGKGTYSDADRTITWTIEAEAAQEGDITYSVTVNDEALQTDELTNTATIALDGNDPKAKVEATVDVPQKSVENGRENAAAGDLQVGDILTYTIEYANSSDGPVNIIITDVVSAGLTIDENSISDNGTLGEDNTITWNLTNVAAGTEGTVSFKATVNEAAIDTSIENQATLKVGADPEIKTNTVPGTVKSGSLTISKTVKLGSDIDEAVNALADGVQRFEFKLTMVDAKGSELKNDYNVEGAYGEDGNALETVKSGESIFLGDNESAKISGLPVGAKVTVSEVDIEGDGYTPQAGEQEATIVADGASLKFVNVYDAEGGLPEDPEGNGSLVITKQLNNRAMTEGQFSFTIKATGDNAASAAKKIGIAEGTSTTVESDAGLAGTAVPTTTNPFAGMKFDEHDDDVTYSYTVRENGTSGNGYTLDDEVYTVEITAHDLKNGTMGVDVSVTDKEGNPVVADAETGITTIPFVNTYDAGSVVVGADGTAKIEGTKALNNAELSDKQFAFDVVSSKGDKSVVVTTGTNDANGAITFGDITYTTASLNAAITEDGSKEVGWATVKHVNDEETGKQKDVYTFNYTVSEQTPDKNTGITANSGIQSVTVTITDDGTGKLSVAVTYDGENQGLAFENTYGGNAEFQLYITGNKVISADEGITPPTLKAGNFEFTIAGSEGAPMPDVKTVSNTDAGTVSFGSIVYTMENVFGTDGDASAQADEAEGEQQAVRTKTFTYTITESQDKTVAGVTNDTTTKTVEVTVTDLGGGKIKAEVTSEKTAAGTDFTFTNTYKVKGTDDEPTKDDSNGIKVTKKLTGRALVAGEFTFKLYDASGNEVASGTNDANGNVTLSEVHFDKPGFYTYSLREVEGDLDGVTYDRTAYSVSARVIDTDGALSVTWTVINGTGNEALFTNTFTPADTPDEPTKDEGGITITKKLEGRALEAGEFSFELVDEDDNVVATGKNDANGDITLSDVTFTEAGEYHYTLREVAGDLDNVTYDGTIYHVTATVTAGDDGKLQVVWKITDEGVKDNTATFHNVYEKPVTPPTPVDPDPSDPSKPDTDVDKKLTGRDLVDGEFSFTIKTAEDYGDAVSPVSLTGTNDATGNVTFDGKGFTFTEEGDYEFVISEVLPADDDPDTEGVQSDGVTYDEAAFTIMAHVTEKGGKLVVTWENADVPMVFENEYEPGEEPEPMPEPEPEEPTTPEEPVEPTKPEEPSENIPQTGDFAAAAIGGTGLAAVALIATGLYLRRRNSH